MFQKATKKNARIRMALVGPAGSGKTYTALRIARALVGPNGKIALVDTEHGSASHYADVFDFDTVALDKYDPAELIKLIKEAENAGYDCLIVDSLSHFWYGEGGELDMVEAIAARSKSGNTFAAWRHVTPVHNRLVDTILTSKIHQIHTMRTKTEWVVQHGADGKTAPRKVGLAPIMREGIDYEFDVVAELSNENNSFIVTKSRCPGLTGFVGHKVGEDVAEIIKRWLAAPPAADGTGDGSVKPRTEAQAVAQGSHPPHPPVAKVAETPRGTGAQPKEDEAAKAAEQKPTHTPGLNNGSQASPSGNANTISLGQQRLVWARAKSAGLSQEQVAEVLARFGLKRTADITRDTLDDVLQAIEETGKALAKQETEELVPPWV